MDANIANLGQRRAGHDDENDNNLDVPLINWDENEDYEEDISSIMT